MTSVQMHLALTHVPVILSLAGLGMLIVALLIKNTVLTKTSYVLLLIAGVAALPVFFSGEDAEEAIEHLPGVSESIIDRHAEVANLAMGFVAVAGLLSMAALFSFKWLVASRILKVIVLLLAITSGGLMAQTAHLGGQIRHSEIRNSVAARNGNEATGERITQGNDSQKNDDDD
ncbi:MAG TPA: hypothetical protein VFP87_09720 [Chitinophagaceae bacterium]|nr:hypothetical protein [Chitinophagaceae bacterium]